MRGATVGSVKATRTLKVADFSWRTMSVSTTEYRARPDVCDLFFVYSGSLKNVVE